jgi:hypothetical protein
MLHRHPATAAYATLQAALRRLVLKKDKSSNEGLFPSSTEPKAIAFAVDLDLGVGSGAAKRNLIVGVRWGGQGKEEPLDTSGITAVCHLHPLGSLSPVNAMLSLQPSRSCPGYSRKVRRLVSQSAGGQAGGQAGLVRLKEKN